MSETTYFGLKIIDGQYVRLDDIRSLPFFEFWQSSATGSTMAVDNIRGETLVFLSDWVVFSKLFIETGRHRLS